MKTSTSPAVPDTVNAVHLVGRVSWGPETRVLPSGDEVVQLRVVIPRTGGRAGRPGARDGPRRTQVDAIEIACWSARTRAAALRVSDGDLVDIEGSLHRRFYAGGQGRVSRYEVEAKRLRRVRP